jgi:hypothetical protein
MPEEIGNMAQTSLRILLAKLIFIQLHCPCLKNILQMKDGLERIVNRNEYERFKMNTTDGLHKINELVYEIDENSKFINITNFKVEAVNNPANNTVHDLRKGNTVFGRQPARMQMRL